MGKEACRIVQGIKLKIIMNQVWRRRNSAGHLEHVRKLIDASKKFLCLDMEFIGSVRSDNNIRSANEKGRPVLLEYPKANASKDIYRIILEGLDLPDRSNHKPTLDERGMVQMVKSEAKGW